MPPTQPIPYLNDDDQNWLKPFAVPTLADPSAPGDAAPSIASQSELSKMGDDPNNPLKLFAQPQLPATSTPAMDERARQREKDEGELKKLDTPYDYSQHGFLRNLGHVAAGVANVAGTILDPSATAAIPGSWLNNQVRRKNLNEDLAGLNTADQQDLKDFDADSQSKALTEYTKQRPDIAYSGMDTKRSIADDKLQGTYGLKRDPLTGALVEDPTSQAYKSRVALEKFHQASANKDDINADIAQNHYVPGTPEYAEAQHKLAQADQRLQIALAGLTIKREGLDLRKQNTNAALYGTDLNGNELPGTPEIVDDDGNVTPVGSKNAAHAISQQAAVGSYRDLSGSLDHTRQTLQNFFNEGGSLSDPLVVSALNDPHGMSAQVIHGLLQSGLSPAGVSAITALKQYHEQAGILRGATKGTASEAGAQRILDTAPTAGDANDVALSKLDEGRNVLTRLTPGMTRVKGGLTVTGKQSPAKTDQQHSSQQPPPPPKAGEVVDGWKFNGGDAHDPKNWEKVKK